MKIIEIQEKTDRNKNPMKVVTTDTQTKVFVNSKYNKGIYDVVAEGMEVEVEKGDNDFWQIKPESVGVTPKPKFAGGIAKAQEKKAEYIREAQDRKSESIAYFNSLNCAIQIYAAHKPNIDTEKELGDYIRRWRDHFLKEWENYNDPHKEPPF